MPTTPSSDAIAAAVREFGGGDLSLAERTVALVFRQWPSNVCDDQVLAKVTVLNALYSTSIRDVKTAARHIVGLNIDERLARGDLQLVDDIASMTFGDKKRNNLSFASKYCSWHKPEAYQIYDSYVDRLLCEYQMQDGRPKFKSGELRKYSRFMEVIDKLRADNDLVGCSRKDLDQFLWLEGRKLVLPEQV